MPGVADFVADSVADFLAGVADVLNIEYCGPLATLPIYYRVAFGVPRKSDWEPKGPQV